jgi:hypothetical protein
MITLHDAASHALADLEGIMPEIDPSGDKTHSGWTTIMELKEALNTSNGKLGRYDILCDKCGKIIPDGELCPDNHVVLDNGDTICLDCLIVQ